MQRILHIVGKMDRAGAETMVMNLYRKIDRSQFQFDFITFTSEQGDYDGEILDLGGRIIPINGDSNIARMVKLYTFFIKNRNYNVIHCHMLLNSMFPLIAATLSGVQGRIVHSHSTVQPGAGFINSFYARLAKIIINNLSTDNLACGKEAGLFLFSDSNKFSVIPNGVDVEKLSSLRQEGTQNSNEIVVIQIGRLVDIKNPFFSINIAIKAKEKSLPFKLYFVGQGPLEKELKEEVRKKSLEEYVFLLGLRSDVAEIMASADVLIMPSIFEGFPMVLAESQSVGIPAVVSAAVPQEVDLGLNLITFLPIKENYSEWLHEIMEAKAKSNEPKNIRIQKLQKAGFDINQTAKRISSLYKKYKSKQV